MIILFILSSYEMAKLLNFRSRIGAIAVSMILPIYLFLLTYGPDWINSISFIDIAALVLIVTLTFFAITRDKKRLNMAPGTIMRVMLLLLYPGIGLYYMWKLIDFEHTRIVVLLIITVVMVNDVFAYIGGKLLGGKSSNLFIASPAKSIAGYISGMILGTAVLPIAALFLDIFANVPLFNLILMGFLLVVAASLGDLGESVFKRVAGKKDSGWLALGRGGILDTADSFIFALPVMYWAYPILIGI